MSLEKNLSSGEKLAAATAAVYESLRKDAGSFELKAIGGVQNGDAVFYKTVETEKNKRLRYELMKAVLENPIPLNELSKTSITLGSNLYGYDLRAPSLHLIPWLSPLRDITPRVQHAMAAEAAHWKVLRPATFSTAGFVADPFIPQGARAPQFNMQVVNKTATYVTIGVDGSDTYEAQSAGQGYEDPLATARFLGLESLYVREEDALLGGNAGLIKLGTANTPTGTGTTNDSAATLNGTYYIAVVGLTYSGIRNQSVSTGLIGQKTVVAPDGKTMTINGGIGIKSAISSGVSVSTGHDLVATVTQKAGEFGYAWFVGASNNPASMYLQAITTTPILTLASLNSSTQALSTMQSVDYSYNDGVQGGQNDQVTAFDGYLTQIIAASQESTPNSYYTSLGGSKLTPSGRGSVVEIDTALQYLWDNFRTTADAIYVNSQQMLDITASCLSNASGPLVRYEVDASGENYNLTASGVIAFYFNPFAMGGKKIPIIIHPTIPAGTIFMRGNNLPPYFKKSNMQNVSEVLCRRDYYGVDFAARTREYEFGTYAEEVLAVYAPFTFGVITGIAPGHN